MINGTGRRQRVDVQTEAAGGTAGVTVRTLGGFELTVAGRRVDRWRAGKARNLLQFLLLRPGRVVPTEVLHEALWPENPRSTRSSSLKVAAHMLRRVLESPCTTGGPAPLRLITREPGYLLEVHDASVDFERFEQLVDLGHTAQQHGRRDRATSLYAEAAGLYGGDFLPDEAYDWVDVRREWLRSRLLCALPYLVESDLERGDHGGVLRWCRQLLEVEPCHEESYRALMLVHAHLGQLTQVERWYGLCVGRLRDQLQTGPQRVTRRLHALAVRGELTGGGTAPELWRGEPSEPGGASLLRTA